MSVSDLSSRDAVLAAIDEFDRLGRDEFLAKYGFGKSWKYGIRHEGETYDSKAVAGAAHGYEFPDEGPLSHEAFSGGLQTHVPRLRAMGFEVVDLKAETEEPSRAFIFQSNPKLYDIDGAVQSLQEMNWTVAQSKNQIHAGDRVYIWRSGPEAGIIAEGTILTDPAMLPDQEGPAFIRDPEKFEGEQLRVRLSIDRVLDIPLSRNSLKEHPVLGGLGIINFANATNYNIKPEEDEALQALLGSSDDSGSVWWVNQGSSYEQEKQGEFVWAPLASQSGASLSHWTRLRDARAGDRVLHYANGSLRAVGEIIREAEESQRPAELPEDWTADGLRVRVQYRELDPALPLGEIPIEWRIEQGGPFTADGAVQQGYFYLLSDDFVRRMASRFPELALPGSPRLGEVDHGDLAALIAEWKDEVGYPTDRDRERQAQRRDLAEALSVQNLDWASESADQFDLLNFGQLAHAAYGNPGPQSVVHRSINADPENKRRLAAALRHLIYDGEQRETDRLDDVLLKDEWRVPGFGESLATKALAVVYPDRWLPLFQTDGDMGKRVLMQAPELGISEPTDFDGMTVGQRIEWSNDVLRGVLDPYLGDDPWGQGQFLYWLRDRHADSEPTSSLAAVSIELNVDESWLEGVTELLREKRQVIFQGPPGTGKTFIARRLARHFADLGGASETVQFHPSYAYEDFVEGYRPRLVGKQPGFELVEGPLKRLARRAEADKDHIYVLVIDELNRGNVAKVFGELYYLLEYREDRIRLQYTEESGDGDEDESKFGLPRNLWIIATMNTADRSIALMDAALRRRFYFVDLFPDRPPVQGLLGRWLKRHGLWDEFGYLPGVLDEANLLLGNPEAAIGPSHFLLKDPKQLNEERIERVWTHGVMPYLEEQLIGEPERRTDFALDALRRSADGRHDRGEAEATPEAEGDSPDAESPQPDVAETAEEP